MRGTVRCTLHRDHDGPPLFGCALRALEAPLTVFAVAGSGGFTRAVIFSKNRAGQLELLVRSLREQVQTPRELSLAVLYAASTPDFRRAYDLAREIHPEVDFRLQDTRPLKRQIQDLVEAERREFFTFFVDDIVAVRPFGWSDREFDLLRSRSDVASLALRLHPGVRYCQPLGLSVPAPPLDADRTWDWRGPRGRLSPILARLMGKRYPQGDWAGSMFMDGYVFRHAPFIEYFAALPEIPYVTRLEPIMLGHPLPRSSSGLLLAGTDCQRRAQPRRSTLRISARGRFGGGDQRAIPERREARLRAPQEPRRIRLPHHRRTAMGAGVRRRHPLALLSCSLIHA